MQHLRIIRIWDVIRSGVVAKGSGGLLGLCEEENSGNSNGCIPTKRTSNISNKSRLLRKRKAFLWKRERRLAKETAHASDMLSNTEPKKNLERLRDLSMFSGKSELSDTVLLKFNRSYMLLREFPGSVLFVMLKITYTEIRCRARAFVHVIPRTYLKTLSTCFLFNGR